MCMYYVGIPDPSSVCAHMILCIIIPNMLETERESGDDGEDGTWYAYTFITLGRKGQSCQVHCLS